MPGKGEKGLCPVARPLLGSKAVRQRGQLGCQPVQKVCNPLPLQEGDLALASSRSQLRTPFTPLCYLLV